MDYQNEKSHISHKNFDSEKRESSSDQTLEYASLKEVSLEERRKEAKKPLFLIRYE